MLIPPPTSVSAGACSYTRTSKPARCSATAAVSPPRPAPMTAILSGAEGMTSRPYNNTAWMNRRDMIGRVMGRQRLRAIVFDAGHTLLEMDYARLTAYLASRGHDLGQAAVTEAERRARMRLDTERAAQASRERTGEGRYVRYLTEYLGIADDAERHAIAEW